MDSDQKIVIREVSLRDGLRSEKHFVPTEKKLSLTRDLRRAGVRYLETTSFVSPKPFPNCHARKSFSTHCLDRS